MSYQSAKRYPLSEKQWVFSWWVVDNIQDIDMQPYFSPYLRNARLEWQSIVIRPWHNLFAELTAWSFPKWIGSYLRANSANDVLVVRHNQWATDKLVTITEWWVITSIATAASIASNNKMRFQNVWDVVYAVNGSDNFGKLSWTTYTTPNTGISNFAPAFTVVFNSSHWASGWATNSNKVYKSVADNYEDFNSAWSDIFTFEEQITWLCATSQSLFYFTTNTISVTDYNDITDTAWTITYWTRALTVKEWAANHDCICTLGNNIYYLSSSISINKIARGNSINWFEVLELSDREYEGIKKFMSSLDKDQSNAFAVAYPDQMLIKWFLYSQWATFPDVCIVYDTIRDKFLIDWQKYFYWWIYFKWYNYTISAIEAKVYIDEFSQTDEDTAIPFEYWTKWFYLWSPTEKKLIREARTLVDINELAELECYIDLDWWQISAKTVDSDNIPIMDGWIWVLPIWEFSIWEDWYDDSSSSGDDEYNEIYVLITKWNLNRKGRKVRFRYINNSLAGKVRLKSIELKTEWLPMEANSLTR